MKVEFNQRYFSLVQSIRFSREGAIGNSISDFITESLKGISEPKSENYHFNVVSNYNGDLSLVPGGSERYVNIDDELALKTDSILDDIKGKWVIADGVFKGKGFDLTSVTEGRSIMYFGAAMSHVVALLNKSTTREVWVDAKQRGKLKGCLEKISFLLLECVVPKANPHKGVAFIQIVTIDFRNNSFSSRSVGFCEITNKDLVLKLAMEAVFGDLSLDDYNERTGKHHERSTPSHDEPCL